MADDGYLVGFEDGSGNFVEVGRFNNQAEDVTQPIEIRHSDSGNSITIGQDGLTGIRQVPVGGIMMWSGTISNIPDGWTLCDGTNGAPDLRDRFIAGAGGEYNTNDTGGEDSVTLTESEMPSHNHSGTTTTNGEHSHEYENNTTSNRSVGTPDSSTATGFTTESTTLAGSHSHNLNIDNTGGDTSHENRPQFYALAFIYKL